MKTQKTLVQKILLEALDTAIDFNLLLTRPSLWRKDLLNHNRKVIYNTFLRLKNSGFLEEVEERGKKHFKTSLSGKAKVLKFLIHKEKWDEKWRIVVFDIPEKNKHMRNFFRSKLSEMGFRKLQESVWICPYNIAQHLENLIELCQAEAFVHYLLVEEIDHRDVLMKLFKLSEVK